MVLKTFTYTKPNNVCLANNRKFWKRVVEIQQTKLNSHFKQIKTSECWKPWQEESKSIAANYSLCVENYIFWKSSSQNAHPLIGISLVNTLAPFLVSANKDLIWWIQIHNIELNWKWVNTKQAPVDREYYFLHTTTTFWVIMSTLLQRKNRSGSLMMLVF